MTKLTKARLIHQAIADDIVHGRLAPGASLDETSIAATFPLSEAAKAQELSQRGHGRGRIILHIA